MYPRCYRTYVRGLLLVAGALTACGPVQSTSVLVDAAASVAAARTAGAERTAPYEFVSAEAYLAKAREEQGHAEYELSIALGQRSIACARAALARAEGGQAIDPGVEPHPDPRCLPARKQQKRPVIRRRANPGLRFRPLEPEKSDAKPNKTSAGAPQ